MEQTADRAREGCRADEGSRSWKSVPDDLPGVQQINEDHEGHDKSHQRYRLLYHVLQATRLVDASRQCRQESCCLLNVVRYFNERRKRS